MSKNRKAELSEVALAAGQMLLVGFDGQTDIPDSVRLALSHGQLGGVILFARNVRQDGSDDEMLRQVATLNAAIAAAVPESLPAPFIAVDQEGGRVRRLKRGVSEIPAMGMLGATRDRDLSAKVGEVVANELSALGFNLNFAPVLDVNSNPDNPIIGDRSFGADPVEVAEMAGAFTVGHYMAGVVPCGKHFPGHGDTSKDSHVELPIIEHDMERLRRVELLPFARAIKGGIPMIMTAHLLVKALDDELPITLSPRGVGSLLRAQMGFDGVIISDDLEMKAIDDHHDIEEVVELGLTAGLDVFLICHTEDKWQRAYAHLLHLAETDDVAQAQILASARRIRSLKQRYLPKGRYEVPDDLRAEVGTPEHAEVLSRLAAHASS